jgi:hypothetical protein
VNPIGVPVGGTTVDCAFTLEAMPTIKSIAKKPRLIKDVKPMNVSRRRFEVPSSVIEQLRGDNQRAGRFQPTPP